MNKEKLEKIKKALKDNPEIVRDVAMAVGILMITVSYFDLLSKYGKLKVLNRNLSTSLSVQEYVLVKLERLLKTGTPQTIIGKGGKVVCVMALPKDIRPSIDPLPTMKVL